MTFDAGQSQHHQPHLLFVVNDTQFMLSHRLPVALAALRQGYRVTVASPSDGHENLLLELGMQHVNLPLRRGFASVKFELRALVALNKILRTLKPDLVHAITAKPVILAGVLTRLYKIPSVAAISGLGHVFVSESLKARVLRPLVRIAYSAALRHRFSHVIVQNQSDAQHLLSCGATSARQMTLIPGSGVDLQAFPFMPLPEGETIVALPARMLGDKGVYEFFEAARLLLSRGVKAQFQLLGKTDPLNPSSVPEKTLRKWTANGPVKWLGHAADMVAALAKVHIIALPSYREGFPKSVIDAAAIGRAAVVTDVPGCRDSVVDGKTGLLVQPHSATSLADALEVLIKDRPRQIAMGLAARQHAEKNFSIHSVCECHLNIYRQQLAKFQSNPARQTAQPAIDEAAATP